MSGKIRFYLFSLFIVFCSVTIFYFTGCCSKGGSGGFILSNVGGGYQSEPKLFDVKVNEDGSITKTLAPSGRFSIEAPQNTLNKDVVIHIVENLAIGNESDIYHIGSFIYAIRPDREEKTVKMQTNPLILTFSNEKRIEGAENYYIGIKEIGDKEWQFSNVYSSSNSLIGSNGPTGFFEYKLYKDNVLVALFADFNKNIKDKPKVLSMVASMPKNIIETFEGRYNENAVVKLNFIGDNLICLKADDYRIRLRYANSANNQVNIRIDGKTADYVSGVTTNKYEAFGALYAHYYEFIPTAASYSANVMPELSFTINFKNFPVEDFANDFIVEAFKNSDNVLPFNCSTMLHFDTKEKEAEPEPEPESEPEPEPGPQPEPQPEPVIPLTQIAFSITSNNSDLYDEERNLYYLDPSFTLTPNSNYDFSNEEKAKISKAVTVIGADSNIVTKTWKNGSLVIGFSDNLIVNTEYTVKMGEVKDIDGVAITPFADYVFKTMEAISITLVSGESNIIDVPNNLYHCRPQFTISPGYEADNEARTIIAEAVSVTGVDAGNITKTWVNGSLILGFSSNLTTNTEYTVTMSEVSGINRMAFSVFQPFNFKTTADSYIALVPDEENVFINTPSELYHCRPSFTITPSIALGESDRATIAGAIHISNVDDGNMTKNWNASGCLVLGVNQNLVHDTEYTISIDAIGEIAGANLILFQPLTFRTVSALNLAIAPDAGNVFVSTPTELYHCRPTFTITPSMSLHDDNRDKIAAAIRVTNVNDSNITREWDNTGNLHISFSQDLNTDTNYTLSMESVNDITGISVTSFAAQNFTTIKPLTFTVTPDVDNVYEAVSPKYHCRPAFTISPNYDLSYLNVASKTLLLDSVSVSDSNGLTKAWDGNNIRVTFSSNQNSGGHSLTMAAVNGLVGITVTPFVNYDFSILDTLTFTVTPAAGNVYTALSPKYQCRPVYTITTNFNLNAEDQTKISNAISVSNVSANKITKNWSNANTLNISFTENLNSDTTYTLTMESVTGMDNVNINSFSNQTFSTIPQLAFDITPANDNVFYGNKYHCNPTFTITPSFTVSSGDKSTIEAALSVSGVNNSNLSKSWSGNNLLLGFNNNIATNTDFTISMANINSLTDVNVTSFDDFDFSTIPDLIVTLATSSTTLVKKAASTTVLLANGKNFCYCSGSSFTISTNMTLDSTNKTKIFEAISLTGIDSGLVSKSWNGEKVAISFNSELTASTSFSIQMAAIDDINGVTVKPFSTYNCTTFYHKGKGTDTDPFTIYTPAQLACLDLYPGEAYYYKQMENLDLSVYDNWKPIGSGTSSLAFRGKYDGYNKTISNATISCPDEEYVGLFAYTISNYIKDISLNNIYAEGKKKVGALIGASYYSNFSNISANYLTASGTDAIGGFIGDTYHSSIIDSSFNNFNVVAKGIWIGNVIGLCHDTTTITSSSVTNSSVIGRNYIGGFAGEIYANCQFNNIVCDNVTVRCTDSALGGFSGYCINSEKNNIRVINSHIGDINAYNSGGFIGVLGANYNDITTNCLVRDTEIISKGAAGGFVADYYVSNNDSNIISNCFVYGSSVSGVNYTGGFMGRNGNSNGGGIKNSGVINTSVVSSGSYVGGFGGQINVPIEKCYVIDGNVSSNSQIGGFVGITYNGSFNKCFVKNTSVGGHQFYIAGFAGNTNSLGAIIDSCYITDCSISSEVDLGFGNSTDYSICGFVASNSGTISNCYSYNSTVTGKVDYGALIGIDGDNGELTTVKDCFVSQDHNIIVAYSGTTSIPVSCFYNIADLATFKSKIWSDSKTIEEGSTAWANYDTTSFPPQLKELAEP